MANTGNDANGAAVKAAKLNAQKAKVVVFNATSTGSPRPVDTVHMQGTTQEFVPDRWLIAD